MKIAIVGMSALFPGSRDLGGFWRDIVDGADRLTEVPKTHWLREDYFDARPGTPDKVYTTRGGFLEKVDFSPLEFGMPPNTLPATDTAQLLALLVAKEVLRDATRGQLDSVDRSRFGVILGVASATELVGHMSNRLQIPVIERAMSAAGLAPEDIARTRELLSRCYVPWQENTFPGLLGNVVAGRIANRFDLGGTNMVLDAACAGSLAGVSAAVNELVVGRADLVVTGGVDALNDILMFMCFGQTGALSPSGDCRPFSANADGTMLGEGIGMLALRRLEDAERDGDPIYAVIRGVGSSSDGRAKSIYAPLASGQAMALRRAYEAAGYGPETVGLVEAHGTATAAGDLAEFESLCTVWNEAGASIGTCAIGSVKSQIGHTKAAAGAAGLIKAALALHQKVLPRTIKVDAPNPAFAIDATPFYINTETRPWIEDAATPRRASVSALGFGGTNFHVALEEYVGPAPRPARHRAFASELVVVGASSREELGANCRKLAAEPGTLPSLARRAQLAFDVRSAVRLAVVASDRAMLGEKLERVATTLASNDVRLPDDVWLGEQPNEDLSSIAFLYPGQGSQYVGMGRDVAVHFEQARAVWDRSPASASDVFPPPRFSDEARQRDEERLTATDRAQPAIVIASVALTRLLATVGVRPACVGGHSLGEVTALAAAGVVTEDEAIRIARVRGATMAAVSKEVAGSMTALVTDRATACAIVSGIDVTLANDNAPRQVVLSGSTTAIEAAEARLREAKISHRRLSVATAFHSPIVSRAVTPFGAALADFDVKAPTIPVYANATAATYPAAPDSVRAQLAAAIAEPVRFVEQIEAMYAAGVRTFIEVGPESVLSRLVGRCLGSRPHAAIPLDRRDRDGVTSFWLALAELAARGVAIDFAPLWSGFSTEAPPSKDAKLVVQVSGSNYGKPSTEDVFAAAPKPSKPTPRSNGHATMKSHTNGHSNGHSLNGHHTNGATPRPVEVPPPPAAANEEVLRALAELHAPAIAAQREYERLITESHIAFLKTIEASYQSLSPVSVPVPVPENANAVGEAKTRQATATQPIAGRGAVASASATTVVAPRPIVAPQPPPAPSIDLQGLVLSVVSEKTGYPTEMLDLGMDLEADLGIDSIKRVEIFSAVRAKAPSMPPVDTGRMATLRTLDAIIAYVGATPTTNGTSPKPLDLTALVLEIVAEKTGYPAEMVELDMDLESDLGIDSIKRVEILAAMRARAPSLPAVDTTKLAALRTLRQIADHMQAPGARSAKPSASNGAATRAASPERIHRSVLRAVAAPALGFALPGLTGAATVFITPVLPIASALAAALAARGVPSEVVASPPPSAEAIVHVGGLTDAVGRDDLIAVNRDAFAVARAAAPRLREHGGTFVTVQDTGGAFGVEGASERAWAGGLLGLVRTVAKEWPRSHVRAIDIARGGRDERAIADAIANELTAGGVDQAVGLSATSTRFALASEDIDVPSNAPTFEPGAVFVVSGGARGVTAAAVIELAKTAKLRFVLLGRSALETEAPAYASAKDDASLKALALGEARREGRETTPKEVSRRVDAILHGREIRATLRNITEAGSEARYVAVDVQDRESLAHALADIRTAWGPIRGLVHGAGVLADGEIATKTDEQFERVFATKVLGLAALLDATKDDPLAWLCTFSSIAARLGNAGQSDYAMANQVLNGVIAAEAARRPNCRAVSIGWGPWDGGMVTPSLRAHFLARGARLLSIQGGARAFVDELGPGGALDVVITNGPTSGIADGTRYLADVLVDRNTHPELDSHRPADDVVLPVVLALEWFARLASPLLGSSAAVTFEDVRVLRGIKLPAFDERPTRFRLVGEVEGGSLRVALEDDAGQRRYSATVRPTATLRSHTPRAVGARDTAPFYGPGLLFSGPHLQVLETVDGLSADRASATLRSGAETGFRAESWQLDVAAIDGALQLAVLHGYRRGGGLQLPLRLERVTVARRSFIGGGELRADLDVRSDTAEHKVCDVVIVDRSTQRAVIEIAGAELYAVPSQKP
jgi:acyl transferase domain-containing protein